MGVASEFERCCQVTGVYDHTRRQCVFGARITRYMFVFFFSLQAGSRIWNVARGLCLQQVFILTLLFAGT